MSGRRERFSECGKMAITINDIARYARVSKSTVSRVLNNVQTVSEQTRVRVNGAMNALNYKPSATARNLALQRSDMVAVLVQDIRNPYYSAASWHAERLLKAQGFHMIVFNADNDPATEREILETVVTLRVGGILCVGGNRDPTNLVNFHSRNDLPIVLVDRHVHGYDIPTINLDNHAGERRQPISFFPSVIALSCSPPLISTMRSCIVVKDSTSRCTRMAYPARQDSCSARANRSGARGGTRDWRSILRDRKNRAPFSHQTI